jgi:UDPglucose 6-dehydrogenase
LFNKIKGHFPEGLAGKTFALWGLSFKPKTDDMREAPSLVIIKKLLAEGCQIKAYDPIAMREAAHYLGDSIEYAQDQHGALIDADALLIITEWPEFRAPNFKVIGRLMKNQVIFDGRNIYDSKEMEDSGFTYYSIGTRPHFHTTSDLIPKE